MKTRSVTGVIVAALLLLMCYFHSTPAYYITITVLCAAGVYEMVKCIGLLKKPTLIIVSELIAVGVCLASAFVTDVGDFALIFVCVIFAFLVFVFSFSLFSKGKTPVDDVFSLFTTTLYIIAAFSSLIVLENRQSGAYLILIAIFMPLISDVFAYFCGYLFGKHKLIPDVSPKKTVEGSIGGMFFCGVACAVFGCVVAYINGEAFDVMLAVRMFLLGLIVSVISQIGDLVASVIKRRYGIKDYGKIFPGHGGVLDRFDSVMMTSPIILMFTFIPSFVFIV